MPQTTCDESTFPLRLLCESTSHDASPPQSDPIRSHPSPLQSRTSPTALHCIALRCVALRMREALGVRSCRRRSDAAAEQQPPRHLLFAALLEPLCLSCAHKHTSCSSPLLSTRILSTRLDSTACRAHCERLPSGLPPPIYSSRRIVSPIASSAKMAILK